MLLHKHTTTKNPTDGGTTNRAHPRISVRMLNVAPVRYLVNGLREIGVVFTALSVPALTSLGSSRCSTANCDHFRTICH